MYIEFKSNRLEALGNGVFALRVSCEELPMSYLVQHLHIDPTTSLGRATLENINRQLRNYALMDTLMSEINGDD